MLKMDLFINIKIICKESDLREVVGDDKNDKKRVANLNEENKTMKKCYYLKNLYR